MQDGFGGRIRRDVLAAGAAATLAALCPRLAAAREDTAIKVAVAANFTEPAQEIAANFEKSTGRKLLLSFGSTGQFYAQIKQGAPFDILLSADKATPAKAIAEGQAVAGTAFTYALGKLVLYSKSLNLTVGDAVLRHGSFNRIAIANPATAPYGTAAIETLKALAIHEAILPKLVQGNSIGQTYQFVATGNAELGFVALSQVILAADGSRWDVPENLHTPIAQDAVLLKTGANNEAAKTLLTYLKQAEARVVIEKYGYGLSE